MTRLCISHPGTLGLMEKSIRTQASNARPHKVAQAQRGASPGGSDPVLLALARYLARRAAERDYSQTCQTDVQTEPHRGPERE